MRNLICCAVPALVCVLLGFAAGCSAAGDGDADVGSGGDPTASAAGDSSPAGGTSGGAGTSAGGSANAGGASGHGGALMAVSGSGGSMSGGSGNAGGASGHGGGGGGGLEQVE